MGFRHTQLTRRRASNHKQSIRHQTIRRPTKRNVKEMADANQKKKNKKKREMNTGLKASFRCHSMRGDFCVGLSIDADELVIIWLLALIWHLICCVADETLENTRCSAFLVFFRFIFICENWACLPFHLFHCGRIRT